MQSHKSTAYKLLKDRIINCQLQPNDVIDQNEIMNELGISRTPVREAIAALEQENLVTIFPRRGVVVSGISANEISNITVIRGLIEPYLANIAASTADPVRLEEFLSLFDEDVDFLASTRADHDFHMYLAELSNNSYLIHIMDLVLSSNMRLIILAAGLPNRLKKSNEEHRQIIRALLDRNGDEAEEKMREHLRFAMHSSYESTKTLR